MCLCSYPYTCTSTLPCIYFVFVCVFLLQLWCDVGLLCFCGVLSLSWYDFILNGGFFSLDLKKFYIKNTHSNTLIFFKKQLLLTLTHTHISSISKKKKEKASFSCCTFFQFFKQQQHFFYNKKSAFFLLFLLLVFLMLAVCVCKCVCFVFCIMLLVDFSVLRSILL